MGRCDSFRRACRDVSQIRVLVVTICTPLLLLPLPLVVRSTEANCAFVVILMAIFWTSEIIPLPATSLLPAFLFPLLGVMTAGDVCKNYIKDTSMLYVGGLLVAIAIEKLNLHKRIALRVLLLFGADPKWLIFGMMLPTWLLSMWISNTATAAMMVPIASAVLQELKTNQNKDPENPDDDICLVDSKEAPPAGKPLDLCEMSMSIKATEDSEGYGTFGKPPSVISDVNAASPNQVSHELTHGHVNGLSNIVVDGSGTVPISTDKNTPEWGSRLINGRSGDNLLTGNGSVSLTAYNQHNLDSSNFTHTTGSQSQHFSSQKDSADDEDNVKLAKAMMLSIAYAANVGGFATLTGTPPNLVLQGQVEIVYKKYGGESPISYTNWMIFAFPLAVLCFVITWMWLLLFFLRKKFWNKVTKKQEEDVKLILRTEYKKLGRLSGAEITVLVLFVILALLWLSRNPVFIPGWGSLFKDGFVKDSTAAMFIAIILFILPIKFPRMSCCGNYPDGDPDGYKPILDWNTVSKKMPWGIILLFGGGFALADGCQKSGLSRWVGGELTGLSSLDPWVTNFILSFIVAFATEVTSNLATATLLLPILADLALVLGLNPLYFMMTAVVATSFAFMLPVATPPNAIVFSYGNLKVTNMASAGAMMNIVCVLFLNLAVNTWANAYFDLDVQPDIFKQTSFTPNASLTLEISTMVVP